MADRFFLDSEIVDQHTTLAGDQAHHAIHVMRYKVGDSIILFDGQGTEHTARIVNLEKKRVQLEIESSRSSVSSDRLAVTIAACLPKGDRQKFMIEKLVELGVACFIPLKTSRSVAVANEKSIQRMNRHVIEAAKQCGRNDLLTIQPQHSITNLLNSKPVDTVGLLTDPAAELTLLQSGCQPPVPIMIAIGPEGGFSAEETEQFAQAGWTGVKLSSQILRIETAAIAAAAITIAERMG